MATTRTFDTLGYAKFLISRGFEKEKAEALAEGQHEFFSHDVATKEFVSGELNSALLAQEIRLLKIIGEMFVASVTILLAGIPLIMKLIQ